MSDLGTQPPGATSEELARAVDVLRRGGIVCFPSESVYGLAVDPQSADAVAGLLAVKRARPGGSPIALIAHDLAAARSVARLWPARAQELADAHWPGPLTLVVPAQPGTLPPLLSADGGVGVRVTSHPIAQALAAAFGRPLTATSANRSAERPAYTVAEARSALGSDVALYLDGGECAGIASTVAVVSESGEVTIMRRGAIDLASSQ